MFNMRGIILGFVGLLVLCGAAVSQPFGYVVGPSGGCVLVTGSGGCVGQTLPTLITPVLGVATGTSLALGGATIGTDALAVTGTSTFGTNLTISAAGVLTTNQTIQTTGGNVLAGNGNAIGMTTRSVWSSAADGVWTGSNNAKSNSATISFPTAAATPSFQLGALDVDTGPVAQIFRTQGALAGGTSNVAGVDWTFIASPGKGTGVGGSFIFQTTPAGSTGTVVGTPTTVMTITGPGAITMPRVTTGTNADFLCLSAGAVVLLQTSACTISSARFKTEIKPYRLALSDAVYRMPVVTFRLKDGAKNKDPNAGVIQMGLIAENVAKIMPLCAIYENDMKTPKSYRQECLIAALVKTVQEQHAANDNLARRVAVLERRR